MAGATPLIAEPDAETLQRFGVPPPSEPMTIIDEYAHMIEYPTPEEIARYGWREPRRYYSFASASEELWTPTWHRGFTVAHPAFHASEVGVWPEGGFSIPAAMRAIIERWAGITASIPPPPWAPRPRVAGDAESAVPDEIVKELVAFAKSGNREDFFWLARSEGVADPEELWRGTVARLHPSASEAQK